MTDEELGRKLDTLIAVTKLAHRDALARTRDDVRSDKVNAAILDATTDWKSSGKMQSAVAKKTKSSTRTVRERISDLIDMGALDRRGGGPTTEYKTSGLI